MKRLAVGAVLLLTGCGPTFPTIDKAALMEAVSQVQGHAVQICSFLPANDSVIAILTDGTALETAYNIADQICKAVTATVPPLSAVQMQAPRRGDEGQCPMVRGVCIEGQFLTAPSAPDIHPPAPEEGP